IVMNTPTMAVEANGRWFAVRYLPTGARCGSARRRTVDRDMVEFYDLSLADDTGGTGPPGFGPLGQYIARYAVATLLVDEGPTGLSLHLGVPVWSLDAPTMSTVRVWLRHQHRRRPIRTITLTDHMQQYDPVTVPIEQVSATLRRWGDSDGADEFQAALTAGDHGDASELAGQLGVAYEVAETG
ncbi:MAG: hypothetical protein ACRDQ0_03460, partial [Pseudonocardia sp.]